MVGDTRVVPDNATVVPSSGKKCGITGQTDNRMNDDERSQDARVHHGDDLINNVRHDGGHQVPVSGVEDDIVVSDENTTVTPSVGRDSGDCTGKDRIIHNNDIQCAAVPDAPRADQRLEIDGDKSPLPDEKATEVGAGIQAEPVQDRMSGPSTSHHSTPAPQSGSCVHARGGVCTIHGPGAKLRWRFGGKETDRDKDGQLKTTAKRIYFYVCSPGQQGGGGAKKWTQTRLSSFVQKRKTTAVDQEDTENRKLGASEVKTPTEGQL